LIFISGLYLFFNINKRGLVNRWFWGTLFVLWFSVLFGFFSEKAPLLGGVIGFELNDFLKSYIGNIGIVLLLLFTLIAYLVLKLHFTPEKMLVYFSKTKKEIIGDLNVDSDVATDTAPEMQEAPARFSFETTGDIPEASGMSDADIENLFREKDDAAETPELKVEIAQAEEEEKEPSETLAEKLVEDFGEFDPRLELSSYTFPTLDLLSDHGGKGSITIDQEELEENKNRIVETLRHYKIEIAHIKATIGPTVTLYEIVPEAGIRISKIKSLEDDIALSLAALGIRIIAPIPGKGTIGIEVPNKNATVVSMRSVIASPKFQHAEMELPVALGKTISNETFVVDLAKMPHLLMAGATGQGKSVGLNAILTSLLYKKHPAEVKFVLVDPKKVELTLFNKIERHFLAKLPDTEEAIITDNTKV
ncbi:MAG: DNA translocase FtsK 4TM domain-containing protein, partial [Sinomicrobium sp.]|nr:DNA translocase FtsK 4TM domain-containing protein [Sinomicrobium sp.]